MERASKTPILLSDLKKGRRRKSSGSVRVQVTVEVKKTTMDEPTTKAQLDKHIAVWLAKGKLPSYVKIKAVAWNHNGKPGAGSPVTGVEEMEAIRANMLVRFRKGGMQFSAIRTH